MLTLNKWMPAGVCCIHFHIYRSRHPEVFFKKGVLRLASLQENVHAEQWVQLYWNHTSVWVFLCKYATYLQQNASFRELLLYTVFIIEVTNVEVLHKQVKYLAGKKHCLTLNVIFAGTEAVIVVDKTRKRSGVYIQVFGIWIAIFAQDVIRLPSSISDGRIYTPWCSMGWNNIACRTILTISKRN